MNASGQTICLNMIVKNEAGVIRRCLDSVRPIIDYWVIVDTGSTDGTQEVIRQHLQDIPGELHERPWENFAHNRSEALALARGHGDYVWVIDADEILEIDPEFTMPPLAAHSYYVEIRYGGCTYLRRQLVDNRLPWQYEGVLHEYITCAEARTEGLLEGLRTVPFHDGARARDPNTYRRDALVLEKALIDEPNNTRYMFYLAQSYRDAGDLEQALRCYKHRAAMNGWTEEVWYSLYQVAALKERLQHPWPETMEAYLAAWQFTPDRAGPLYRIAMHYQAKSEYNVSHLYLERALRVPSPASNRLFVERMIYEYQLPLEYSVAAHYVGQYREAIAGCNALLRSKALPPYAMDQVIRNRRFSLDALFPKSASEQPAPRLHVVIPVAEAGPELDETVESLLRQEGDFPEVTFLVAGSLDGLADRLQAEDERFVCTSVAPGEAAGQVQQFARSRCKPGEVVLAILPGYRLAAPNVLQQVREMFRDAGCTAAWGPYRIASGEMSACQPAADRDEHTTEVAEFPHPAMAFRAKLAGQSQTSEASWRSLFLAAGFEHTRYCDDPWTVHIEPASAQAEQVAAAPAVAVPKLPPISCLMVTYDRLALARRSIYMYAAQKWPERELVIVTDGAESFRKSLERYVEALGVQGVRFLYPDGPRQTLGRLRNLSLEAARGELVCQWDDDDCNHPERLMVQAGHMLSQDAAACFLTDHLQLIEDKRVVCWVDWTLGGTAEGSAQLVPGTLLMRRDSRFRYPEEGQYARMGEDSVLLESLCRSGNVAHLSGAGYLYLYTYHGRNTFSREHHYRLSGCRAPVAKINEHTEKIREALGHYPIARPCFVIGSDGPAFAVA